MRTFIAIELEEEVKDHLAEVQAKTQELCRRGNFTPKENFHLTLHFLGEVGEDDIEYTNNSGDELPIVVNQISYQESYWNGFMDITFEIENLTQTDYKNVSMAVLAWDSEGYPIRICGMYEYAPDYVNYIGLENISPEKVSEYSYTFETADVAYMSVFLSYYEDFDGNKWENPIIEEVEEN